VRLKDEDLGEGKYMHNTLNMCSFPRQSLVHTSQYDEFHTTSIALHRIVWIASQDPSLQTYGLSSLLKRPSQVPLQPASQPAG
jgi:hypothetical protein